MRTDMLYGIIFTTDEPSKNLFIKEHLDKVGADLLSNKPEAMVDFIDQFRPEGAPDGHNRSTLLLAKEEFISRTRIDYNNFLDNSNCSHYYITGEVLQMCKRLKVKEPFDLVWLRPVPNGIRQLNFGNHFFRYEKHDEYIRVLAGMSKSGAINAELPGIDPTKSRKIKVRLVPTPDLYNLFYLDLVTLESSIPKLLDDYNEEDLEGVMDFDSSSKKLFYQLITFMELAPIEEIVLPVGAKHGTKKSADNLNNDQQFPVIIVNKGWNRSITRIGNIDVEGHFRMQAYGPQFSKRRLIFIKPFSYESFPIEARKITITAINGKKR